MEHENHFLHAYETMAEFDDDSSGEVDSEDADRYYETLFGMLNDQAGFTTLLDYYLASGGSSSSSTSSTDIEVNDNGTRAPLKRKRSDSLSDTEGVPTRPFKYRRVIE